MTHSKHPSLGLVLCAALLGCANHERVNVGERQPGSAAAVPADGSAPRAGGSGIGPGTHDDANGTGVTPPPDASMLVGGNRSTAGNTGSTPTTTPSNVPIPSPLAIDKTGPDNPAGLGAADVAKLMEGGPLGDMRWLYPYDETVFPRGMISPIVMWNGDPAADVVYLHIQSQLFEYKGVLKPTPAEDLFPAGAAPLNIAAIMNWSASTTGVQATGKQLRIPQDIWDLAGKQTLGKGDTFTLEISERANGTIRGPVKSQIYIAQADIKGSVYYSSCSSAMQGSGNIGLDAVTGNAKILRIPPGGAAELVLSESGQSDSRCQGCHSVSADGSRLIAQRGPSTGQVVSMAFGIGMDPRGGFSYQLRSDGSAESTTGNAVGPLAAYGALYPNGSMFLATAIPALTQADSTYDFLSTVGLVTTYGGPYSITTLTPATLYDAVNGNITADTGIPEGALMPTFSPDGKRLVFNDLNIAGARGLAVMDYDTRSHKASGYQPLAQESAAGAMRPGWPFFLPDNKAVVFVRTESANFTWYPYTRDAPTQAAATDPVSLPGAPSDLYIADVASGSVTLLARAMGFNTPSDAANDKTSLPFGQADLHRNYFPTVSQVAAGGYFWVFFDTFRHYGNLGVQRALWGFAIDIRPDGYMLDPSHPPFYLPGQEFGAGNNHRAFVALDPCKQHGESCTSAINCCAGTTCSFESGAAETRLGLPVGTCSPPPPREQPPCASCTSCAKLDERCASEADCCDAQNLCINGFCAFVELL